MALIDFSTIKELISDRGAGKSHEVLYKEVLLLVLARAARADSNIESIEIAHVQEALKEATGDEYSKADILTAASSEIYETHSLKRALANATRKLSDEDRINILNCLESLIRSDNQIRYSELEFFDYVATALQATPSEIAGLKESTV